MTYQNNSTLSPEILEEISEQGLVCTRTNPDYSK